MKYLFSETGLKVVESLAFTEALYAFDFDGTLAPIVAEPAEARAPRETEQLLAELSSLVEVVVISGRSVSDLQKRVHLSHKRLIGNHGLECIGAKRASIGRAESVCDRWKTQLENSWQALKGDFGIFLEDKRFSLALHYRKSRNKKTARTQLFSLVEKLEPAPRLVMGKCVFNLVPAGGPHKGIALLEAMVQLNRKCAFYIGDDDTDEDVFSLPDSRVLTARVCAKKTSQAQFYLKRQSEMNRLLRFLIKINKKKNS